mmetsp:Transcript_48089/g.96834  ORF Transcript_48089/g.96834 Transcript_48089/m.96834 type:complete len:177 (-) Transcript_48089:73-603(-)
MEGTLLLIVSFLFATILAQSSQYGGQTLVHGHGPSSSSSQGGFGNSHSETHDTWRTKDQPWRVYPMSAEVRGVARKALHSLHSKQPTQRNMEWAVTSAEKRSAHLRHDATLRNTKWYLTIHVQVGGKYCVRCPNPQLIDGECQVVSVELVHYVAKGTWLIPSTSVSKVSCHEDFLA